MTCSTLPRVTDRLRVALFASLVLLLPAGVSEAASGGPDAAGTTWQDSADGCPTQADPFVLANATSFWDVGLLNVVGPFDLGFAFSFEGLITTEVWVHRSGLVFFEAPPDLPLTVPQAIPTADGAAAFVAPYWDRFDEASQMNDCVYWEQFAGFFKIGWRAQLQSNGTEVRWELYVYPDGRMRVEYLDVGLGPHVGTIGLESPSETDGLQVYRNGVSEDPGFIYGQPEPFAICYQPATDCGNATLGCNSLTSGNTTGSASTIDSYSCSGQSFNGPEDVYTFVNPTTQAVSFSLGGASADLDLLLLDSCDPASCIAIGDSLIERELAPGTYRLVVDGRGGAAGPYDLTVVCGNALEPSNLRINGAEGECFDEHKVAWLAAQIAQADVLFAIDLTASMGQERSQLQSNMQMIIDRLQLFIPDVAYGLAHYRDYDATGIGTVPCTFDANNFGNPGDYPYQLEQPITTSRAVIQAAVDRLPPVGGGNDAPESYSRVLWEAVHDGAIAWRPGSRRIVVNFGDELPHDCNVRACIGGVSPTRRGVDLGRDNAPGGGDDLPILSVIQELVDARIALVHLDSGEAPFGGRSMDGAFTYTQLWDCWAQRTGGVAQELNGDGTVPSGVDLSELIGDVIEEQSTRCTAVELIAEPGFEDWLVSSTPIHVNVDLPARLEFDIRVCVPPGTPAGTHTFQVQLHCSGGFVAYQEVTVIVGVACEPAIVSRPADQEICPADTATLDASGIGLVNCEGSVTYQWRDGLGNSLGTGPVIDVSPTVTTDYTVTVGCSTNSNCSTSDTVRVTVNPEPIVDAGADKIGCLPSSVALDDADGGIGDVYLWDDGGAGGSFSPSPNVLNPVYSNPSAGSFTLTLSVRDVPTGCESADALEVELHPSPVVEAGPNREGCIGEPIDLAGAAPGAADAFLWSDGGAGGAFSPSASALSPSYSNASAGSFTLTFRATVTATGCSSSDSLTVRVHPDPVIDAGADKETCAGDSLDLSDAASGTADTFLWSDGGAGGSFSPSPNVLRPSYSKPSAGMVVLTLTATDSMTGCTSVDSLRVTVRARPVLAFAAARDINDCNLGMELTWSAATFPSGNGVYNVYRSEISCADAVTRAPIAQGLTVLSLNDRNTVTGALYSYVVEAEDSAPVAACSPSGPVFGGLVARACTAPPVEEFGTATFPEGVFIQLFVRHDGQQVTNSWDGARSLLPGETFRLLKTSGHPTESWSTVNGVTDRGLQYTETDTESPRQFFDLRVANECGDISLDEFPPSY